MDLVVSRRFDVYGVEHFSLTHKGITVCAYTPDVTRVQRALADIILNSKKITNYIVGFYDVESKVMKESDLSLLLTKNAA